MANDRGILLSGVIEKASCATDFVLDEFETRAKTLPLRTWPNAFLRAGGCIDQRIEAKSLRCGFLKSADRIEQKLQRNGNVVPRQT